MNEDLGITYTFHLFEPFTNTKNVKSNTFSFANIIIVRHYPIKSVICLYSLQTFFLIQLTYNVLFVSEVEVIVSSVFYNTQCFSRNFPILSKLLNLLAYRYNIPLLSF